MSISGNIKSIKASIPEYVSLVAVSKFHPAEAVMEAYDAGQRIFGESRAQELKQKHQSLPADIEWHFIGQLQSNKVKDIAPFVHTIHSIDSLKLIEEIEKHASKHKRQIRVLLEIHVAKEESKAGFSPEECFSILDSGIQDKYPNTIICGLMGMATNTEDETLVREEFQTLNNLFKEVKNKYFATDNNFNILSMGMSSDYDIAIKEGSNMIRVGSNIFGSRY